MGDTQAFQFFLEFYADLPRQGPGDDRITRHILGLLVDLPTHPVTLDMGCGSCSQSIVLAKAGCQVTAVDLHPVILDWLVLRAKKESLKDSIKPVCAGMESYHPEEPVDLIWSEGAVYIIGFENGLSLWHSYLKKGGYLVVSELTWLVDTPPPAVKEYWDQEYPALQTVSNNQAIIKKTGYRWIGSVLLPDEAWDEFYAPQKVKIAQLQESGSRTPGEKKVLMEIDEEIRMFEDFRGTYGYVFYLMQRVS